MIVVSAGLRKSGSGWCWNLTNDLLVRAGHADARAVRSVHGLEDLLRGENCQLERADAGGLARLVLVGLRGGTFAVKTHARPTPGLRVLLRVGAARAICIQRDPRDIVLSALDHAARARRAGRRTRLAKVDTVAEAIAWVEAQLEAWQPWLAAPRALVVRYEALVADTVGELARVAAFLGAGVTERDLHEVVAAYADAGSAPLPASLHFNRGVAGRFRSELGAQDLALCNRRLSPWLQRLGYEA